MNKINVPTPDDYEKGIPSIIWKIYSVLDDRNPYVLSMSNFTDKDKAVSVIKNFMDRGANVFTHFNSDFTKYIIFKNVYTEEYIAKKKEQVREQEDSLQGN